VPLGAKRFSVNTGIRALFGLLARPPRLDVTVV
jgi:hypothetical protein